MFSLLTRTHVEEVSGREITDFLSGCNDAAFQSWWPGTIGDRRVKVRCELGETRAGQDTRLAIAQAAVPAAGQVGAPVER